MINSSTDNTFLSIQRVGTKKMTMKTMTYSQNRSTTTRSYRLLTHFLTAVLRPSHPLPLPLTSSNTPPSKPDSYSQTNPLKKSAFISPATTRVEKIESFSIITNSTNKFLLRLCDCWPGTIWGWRKQTPMDIYLNPNRCLGFNFHSYQATKAVYCSRHSCFNEGKMF